ncbi:MAG TPA: amidohydrolase family protein [Candidatus Polarisedimenticolia bacterium]|nr:amidohydrolase family protein [Candidatus Polarisedimenticolia bacterium]
MRHFNLLRPALPALGLLALLTPIARAAAPVGEQAATGEKVAISDRAATGDIEAARALFQNNLDAIRKRDREAYLACYLNADTLARTGFEGAQLGYDALAKEAGEEWPDLFEGLDLQLVPIRPGMVYGTYRYRVRYGAQEDSGISERLFVKDPGAGWKIAVSTAFSAPPGVPPPPRALVGATLVDGTGAPPVPDAVVILRGGKIDCAGTRAQCPPPKGVDVLDLKGTWITPGIVDAHVHFSQTGWADGRPDFIDVRDRYPYEEVQAGLHAHPERFLRSYLCSGVTSVFDVGGYPWTWELRTRAAADPLAPRVAAAGPLLSTLDFWLNLPAERQFIYLGTEEDARAGVRYLAAHGADAVKVWFIPVAARNFDDMAKAVLAAGEEARARKIPLIVHATGLKEATVALRAGASLLVHSVGDVPVDPEFLRLAKEKQTIYCPTLTVVDGYRRLREAAVGRKAPAVDDPNGCVDPDTLARVAESARIMMEGDDPQAAERRRKNIETFARVGPANLKAVRDAGITIAMGTDAGNPLTLHGASIYAEMEAMQAAGMTPMEVLVASTRSGAMAMHRQDQIGTVEKGKRADLLVLGADPTRDIKNVRQIRSVVRNGKVRAQSELRPAATSRTP